MESINRSRESVYIDSGTTLPCIPNSRKFALFQPATATHVSPECPSVGQSSQPLPITRCQEFLIPPRRLRTQHSRRAATAAYSPDNTNGFYRSTHVVKNFRAKWHVHDRRDSQWPIGSPDADMRRGASAGYHFRRVTLRDAGELRARGQHV